MPIALGKLAALFSLGSEEPRNQFKSSVFKNADPSNLGRSLLEGNKDHLLSQATVETMKQEHQVESLNYCISDLQQQTYAQRLELQDAQHGKIESRRAQVRLQEELSMKEKVLWNTQIRSMHENGRNEKSSRTTSWQSPVQNFKRKSWDNSAAYFSVARNARTDEFYEWLRRSSRCGIKLPWEIVLRFQSACNDSKLSFHAEPRQSRASWHMEYIRITGTLFLVLNFLRLIHPEIILKEFTLAHHKENEDQFHKLQGQRLFSQEMTNKIGAQFQCRHLQEGRRLRVLNIRLIFRKNYVVRQQRQQISELQFDTFPGPQSFWVWKIRFKNQVIICSDFPSEAMLWLKEVEMVDSLEELKSSRSVSRKNFPNFEMLDAKIASALNKIIQNSQFKKKVSLEEQKAQKENRFLRGRQIAFRIYDFLRVTDAHDAVLDYAELFSVTLHNDNIQEFDTRWDEVLLSMTEIRSDEILESLFKLRIRESDRLKNLVELYDMETHQKTSVLNYQKLKTMVKRYIDEKLRFRNFDARIVGKNQNTLPPHLPSQPFHEVEVCRRREVSEVKVTMGPLFDNRVDIIWRVPARERLVNIGILPSANFMKQERVVSQETRVCFLNTTLMNNQ